MQSTAKNVQFDFADDALLHKLNLSDEYCDKIGLSSEILL